MNTTSPLAVVQAQLDAYNAKNLDALMATYAPDAQQRLVHLRNHLARYEIHVADYYMRLGAWAGAVGRAKTVLQEYEQTPSRVDALVILHNAYRELGLAALADDVARIVAANHPEAAARLVD